MGDKFGLPESVNLACEDGDFGQQKAPQGWAAFLETRLTVPAGEG